MIFFDTQVVLLKESSRISQNVILSIYPRWQTGSLQNPLPQKEPLPNQRDTQHRRTTPINNIRNLQRPTIQHPAAQQTNDRLPNHRPGPNDFLPRPNLRLNRRARNRGIP